MRMKRQNCGDFPTDMRIFDRPLQQRPMPEMDTVKIPDRQMNRLHGFGLNTPLVSEGKTRYAFRQFKDGYRNKGGKKMVSLF